VLACPRCGGPLRAAPLTALVRSASGRLVRVTGLPAAECARCGQQRVDQGSLDAVTRLLGAAPVALPAEVAIAH
jgi:hypothetical protein